jgi:threonine dehydrogenase-like Zn-dependent dehydrogenase
MRALVGDGGLRFVERTRAALPGECLVRVLQVGICNTDLEILAGYMNFRGVLGHEFVGVVEAGPAALVGRRVVGEINVGCGACDFCRRGLARHCPTRTVLGIAGRDGAFAETLSLPAGNLHVVPDNVTNDHAVFVEPLAAACEILEQVHVAPDARVCLVGDGKLAILVARVLALTGAALTAVGRHRDKLARMPVAQRFLESEFAPGRAFDVVVEASGQPAGWSLALQAVKPRGVIALKSTFAQATDFHPAPLVVDEITVVGSRCGPFAPALRLLASQRIAVDDMISAHFDFTDAPAAFAAAKRPDALKIIVDVS